MNDVIMSYSVIMTPKYLVIRIYVYVIPCKLGGQSICGVTVTCRMPQNIILVPGSL